MDEKTLLKLSLIIIILGIPALNILSSSISPQNLLNASSQNKIISYNGRITRSYHHQDMSFYTIQMETEIEAAQFDPKTRFEENERVETILRKGDKGFIIEDIRLN